MWWLPAVLALALLSGCAAIEEAWAVGCDAPPDADVSRAPYDNGVALYTQMGQDGSTHRATAWACNEDTQPRYLLERAGECRGSWSWTLTPPGESTATAAWPEGHYGACDFMRLPPGTHAVQEMEVEDAPAGAEWRIRLQVYTQPEQIEDAGGGPVHAVYEL